MYLHGGRGYHTSVEFEEGAAVAAEDVRTGGVGEMVALGAK